MTPDQRQLNARFRSDEAKADALEHELLGVDDDQRRKQDEELREFYQRCGVALFLFLPLPLPCRGGVCGALARAGCG